MITHIALSPDQMRTILAALDEGAAPTLEARVADAVRAAAAEGRPLDLSLQDGQLLMRWVEARRERASGSSRTPRGRGWSPPCTRRCSRRRQRRRTAKRGCAAVFTPAGRR
jgi:hypothetical protein